MYLAVMLIVVSILVFYNEITNKMSLAEILLMVVALLAIIRAALNYIKLNDMISPEDLKSSIQKAIPIEGFSSRKSKVKSRGNNNTDQEDGLIQLMSENAKEYFDADKPEMPSSRNRNSNSNSNSSSIDNVAVSKINSLFENPISNKATFDDIPTTTTAARSSGVSGIESVFMPKIVIGSGDSSSDGNSNRLWTGASSASGASATGADDGMTFPDTMRPTHNLWSSDLDDANLNGEWSQNMDAYNHGRWNPRLYQRPSDYTDYYMPSAYGMSTGGQQGSNSANNSATATNSTTSGSTDAENRRCGQYDNLDMDQAGNMIVRNYTESKKWVPGYTYVPPVYWDVPQRHTSVCQPDGPNVRKLTGLIDRGLPLNVLELNPDGNQAQNEDDVHLTNVGSILPRFGYQETPFSKPYV